MQKKSSFNKAVKIRPMLKNLSETKELLGNFLLDFLNEEEKNFTDQKLAQEAFTKIKDFSVRGKMIRGSLFLKSVEVIDTALYQEQKSNLFLIASALELIHSGLLIHDDIIDQDQKRRGLDTIWHQYEQVATNQGYKECRNYGQSLAICLGSLVQYLANLALKKLTISKEISQKIEQTIDAEIIKTYFAEMLDSKITAQKELPSLEEVMEMYLFKTARYTFSLPLKLAALFTQLDHLTEQNLVKIGENLGLIFQIKDDQIGIFQEENISLKSFASDIREGKKTVFYLYALAQSNEVEQQILKNRYGYKNINRQEIEQIQTIFKQSALPKTDELINNLSSEVKGLAQKLNSEVLKNFLLELLEFNLNRNS